MRKLYLSKKDKNIVYAFLHIISCSSAVKCFSFDSATILLSKSGNTFLYISLMFRYHFAAMLRDLHEQIIVF